MRKVCDIMLILIKDALRKTGRSKSGLAQALGVPASAITEMLKGVRHIKTDEIPIIVRYLDLNLVPIVGYIVGGGSIEGVVIDSDAHVPHVELPQMRPGTMQAFEVIGDGMMPRYDHGDVIVVWAKQRKPLAHFFGQEAVVRCADGSQWLRNVCPGRKRGTATLTSFAGRTVADVQIT